MKKRGIHLVDKNEPLLLDYRPHKWQSLFHASDKKLRLMFAGIRSGKSIGGVMEGIKLAHAGWKTFGVPNHGTFLLPTFPMIKDVLLPIFFDKCPQNLIERFNMADLFCEFKNGSTIAFRSADKPNRMRGVDLHWVYGDELRDMQEMIYDIALGRISQKRGCFFGTTTANGYDWIYRRMIKPWIEKSDSDIDVIMFSSYDNPYYPKEELEKLKKIYPTDFFEQEINVRLVKKTGVIFKEFDRFSHVKEFEADEVKCVKAVVGLDFGHVHPMAMVVVLEDANGIFWIPEEFFMSGLTTPELIPTIKEYLAVYKFSKIYADPSAAGSIEELKKAGLEIEGGNNSVRDGIMKIRELLKAKKIIIHPRCVNLIREFELYRYKDNSESPIKIDDDAVDCCRYALFSGEDREESTDAIITG